MSISQNTDKKEWIHTNIITCCAPALNHTRLLGQSLYELHFKRLCRILDIAASKKNDVIILEAFGCGAFRNNPYIVSEAMMNVIKHYRTDIDTNFNAFDLCLMKQKLIS